MRMPSRDRQVIENIRWFSALSLTQKLRAIEEQIRTTHYLRSLKPCKGPKRPSSRA
jgi:hypothetical protein